MKKNTYAKQMAQMGIPNYFASRLMKLEEVMWDEGSLKEYLKSLSRNVYYTFERLYSDMTKGLI